MTILQAICAAVEAGKLHEPFTARDVAAALRDHGFSYGSLQTSLIRHSRPGPDVPLHRVGPGIYRLRRRRAKGGR